MRGADESRSSVVRLRSSRDTVSRVPRTFVFVLCLGAGFAVDRARRAAGRSRLGIGTTMGAGFNCDAHDDSGHDRRSARLRACSIRAARRYWSRRLLAQAARLPGRAGTFEVAPDGRTYVDRQTEIASFGVAGYALRNVPALISSNLTGYSALCGYDFFTHFPTLIDRAHGQ